MEELRGASTPQKHLGSKGGPEKGGPYKNRLIERSDTRVTMYHAPTKQRTAKAHRSACATG